MKIAVAGAGAMGASFGLLLKQAGNDVFLIDGYEPQVEAVKKKGHTLEFDGKTLNENIPIFFPVVAAEVLHDLDLVLIFTKALQLNDFMKEIQALFSDKTAVLCSMNGMGHEDIILKYVKPENFFIANTLWAAQFVEPGFTRLFPGGNIYIKNWVDGYEVLANEIVDTFKKASLNAFYAEEIRTSIYKKLCLNAAMNALCALFDTKLAEYGATTTEKAISHHIISEIISVAKAEGYELDYDELIKNLNLSFDPNTIGGHYPSMHQDLMQNNRLTEVDNINGIIVKKGTKLGIPTPYNNMVTLLTHAKEEIRGAK